MRKLVFSGLDPTVNESGKKDSKHLQITKKGNKYLRTSLYLSVSSMITKKGNKYLRTSLYLSVSSICHWHPESFISKFVDSKIN